MSRYAVGLVIYLCLFNLLPGSAALVWTFTWIHVKNWAAILESFLSEAFKNLKGFEGEAVTKVAFMSLNMKHINVVL